MKSTLIELAYARQYRALHREKMRAYNIKYYRHNKVARHLAHTKWLANRPSYMKDKLKVHYQERSALIIAAKSVPCKDCKRVFPYYVMDFDHLRDKKFTIGQGRRKNLEVLRQEIAKCEVVCSNCHRERTFKRQKQKSPRETTIWKSLKNG